MAMRWGCAEWVLSGYATIHSEPAISCDCLVIE